MRPFARLASTLLVTGLVLLQLGSCGRAPETPADSDGSSSGLTLTGAGSTFAAPFFEELMEVYRVDHPWLRLSYEVVGSGVGIDRFLAGSVDVGATDAPLSAAETEGIAGGVLHLPLAWLENRAGGFVKPNVEMGRRALASGADAVPEDVRLIVTDPEGARSYPIVTYTWVLLRGEYSDPAKTAALRDIVRWSLTSGQEYAEPLRNVPLPDNEVQAALAELDQVGG